MNMEAILKTLYKAILEGDSEDAERQVRLALEAGAAPDLLLDKAMIPAMGEVGRLFEEGEYYLPEMLIAALAMQGGMSLLRPLLLQQGVEPAGRVVIGTVQGDMHDIGKNLVAVMLEGAGFEVHDLGIDVAPERFVDAVRELAPHAVGLSAMLTTTMTSMRPVIEALQAAGLRDQTKVVVGGAPLNEAFAHQIGADGFAPDANSAVGLLRSLLNSPRQ
jgi:5-methyltetrahydrofolate--homocysteine methyltransferase